MPSSPLPPVSLSPNSSGANVKWTWKPLALNLVPEIVSEAQRAVECFQIWRSERNLTADPRQYDALTHRLAMLAQAMDARTSEFEQFYYENMSDERALSIEKLRRQFRRLLKQFTGDIRPRTSFPVAAPPSALDFASADSNDANVPQRINFDPANESSRGEGVESSSSSSSSSSSAVLSPPKRNRFDDFWHSDEGPDLAAQDDADGDEADANSVDSALLGSSSRVRFASAVHPQSPAGHHPDFADSAADQRRAIASSGDSGDPSDRNGEDDYYNDVGDTGDDENRDDDNRDDADYNPERNGDGSPDDQSGLDLRASLLQRMRSVVIDQRGSNASGPTSAASRSGPRSTTAASSSSSVAAAYSDVSTPAGKGRGPVRPIYAWESTPMAGSTPSAGDDSRRKSLPSASMMSMSWASLIPGGDRSPATDGGSASAAVMPGRPSPSQTWASLFGIGGNSNQKSGVQDTNDITNSYIRPYSASVQSADRGDRRLRRRPGYQFLRKGTGTLAYSSKNPYDEMSPKCKSPTDDHSGSGFPLDSGDSDGGSFSTPNRHVQFLNSVEPYVDLNYSKLWRPESRQRWIDPRGFRTTGFDKKSLDRFRDSNLPEFVNVGCPYQSGHSDLFPMKLRSGGGGSSSSANTGSAPFVTAVPSSRVRDAYAKIYSISDSWKHK